MEAFLSSIMLWPCDFAPRGWVFCEGQELQISRNNPLYALIGTTFGGDGIKTFHLPNLPAVASSSGAPLKYIINLEGIFPMRD